MTVLKKSAIVAIVLGLFASILTGCNTMEGAGKDIQAGGHAITKSAQDAKS